MPDRRQHRGAHPEDGRLFAVEQHGGLRSAVADLSWLLTREYAVPSALKVVGDRYGLNERQRTAVMRCACSDQALASRVARRVGLEAVRGRGVVIDGYNLLTTLEAALGGGVVFAARDSTYRDMASMHGTYRKVEETGPALRLAGEYLAELGAGSVRWLLDAPVSNSGRLKTIMREVAAERGWDWGIELVNDPDPVLAEAEEVVVTADSVILDRCARWANLAREIVRGRIPGAWVVDLE